MTKCWTGRYLEHSQMTNVAKMMSSLSDREENIVRKGENYVTNIFSSSLSVFKVFFLRVVRSRGCVTNH